MSERPKLPLCDSWAEYALHIADAELTELREERDGLRETVLGFISKRNSDRRAEFAKAIMPYVIRSGTAFSDPGTAVKRTLKYADALIAGLDKEDNANGK